MVFPLIVFVLFPVAFGLAFAYFGITARRARGAADGEASAQGLVISVALLTMAALTLGLGLFGAWALLAGR